MGNGDRLDERFIAIPAPANTQLWGIRPSSGDRAKDQKRRCVVCYAESSDGISFAKPNLGLFDYNGDLNNSIGPRRQRRRPTTATASVGGGLRPPISQSRGGAT